MMLKINAQAFSIHCNNHWILLRKIGDYSIDLDSKLIKPKFLPEFDINTYINSMEGHPQLFFVAGDLPSTVRTFSCISEEDSEGTDVSKEQIDESEFLTVKNKRPTTTTNDKPASKRVHVDLTDGTERRRAQLILCQQRRARLDQEKAVNVREKDRIALELSRTHISEEEAAKIRETNRVTRKCQRAEKEKI